MGVVLGMRYREGAGEGDGVRDNWVCGYGMLRGTRYLWMVG